MLLPDDFADDLLLYPALAVLHIEDHLSEDWLEVRPGEKTVHSTAHLKILSMGLVGRYLIEHLGHALAGRESDAPVRCNFENLMILQQAHTPIAVVGPYRISNCAGDHEGGRLESPSAFFVSFGRLQLQRRQLLTDDHLCIGGLVDQLWPRPGSDGRESGSPLGGAVAASGCHHTDTAVHPRVVLPRVSDAADGLGTGLRGGDGAGGIDGEPRLFRRTHHTEILQCARRRDGVG
mmetsp:Transcript_46254/g.109935  ORF Transcript_46254/g.109935 Transcript_46254/m.109935 type:complete len:234 (-) Transcript_46254:1087-1788(-)